MKGVFHRRNSCLKPRHTGRKPRRCSNKPLSCLFEGNMAHELHKPKNIYRYSEPFPEDAPRVQGYDFNQGVDHKALLQSFYNTGFQATHFGRAVREINRMVRWLKPALCLNAFTEPQFIFGPTVLLPDERYHERVHCGVWTTRSLSSSSVNTVPDSRQKPD